MINHVQGSINWIFYIHSERMMCIYGLYSHKRDNSKFYQDVCGRKNESKCKGQQNINSLYICSDASSVSLFTYIFSFYSFIHSLILNRSDQGLGSISQWCRLSLMCNKISLFAFSFYFSSFCAQHSLTVSLNWCMKSMKFPWMFRKREKNK